MVTDTRDNLLRWHLCTCRQARAGISVGSNRTLSCLVICVLRWAVSSHCIRVLAWSPIVSSARIPLIRSAAGATPCCACHVLHRCGNLPRGVRPKCNYWPLVVPAAPMCLSRWLWHGCSVLSWQETKICQTCRELARAFNVTESRRIKGTMEFDPHVLILVFGVCFVVFVLYFLFFQAHKGE